MDTLQVVLRALSFDISRSYPLLPDSDLHHSHVYMDVCTFVRACHGIAQKTQINLLTDSM